MEKAFLLFVTICCYLLLDVNVKTGTRFSLRDKRSRDNESTVNRLIRFSRASCYVSGLYSRSKLLTAKHLGQCYRYINFVKYFLNFIFNTKNHITLHESLLIQNLLEFKFYGDLLYKLR